MTQIESSLDSNAHATKPRAATTCGPAASVVRIGEPCVVRTATSHLGKAGVTKTSGGLAVAILKAGGGQGRVGREKRSWGKCGGRALTIAAHGILRFPNR